MCWEEGVLVFSKLMLLLTMEACPPPTLGLRPRRDLSVGLERGLAPILEGQDVRRHVVGAHASRRNIGNRRVLRHRAHADLPPAKVVLFGCV